MKQERSHADCAGDLSEIAGRSLALADEMAPLPDWSHLGRHILAEAMRRAMARMEHRLARNAVGHEPQAKELS